MAGNVSKKSNRINVTNLVYAILTADESSGTTYGEVKPLSPVMQIQITPSVATGVLYGDGVQQENLAKLNGIAVVLDVNKVKIEDRAVLLGHTFENGVLIEGSGDEAPYIALGYEVEGTGKCKELVWLLKGRAQPINNTVQQSTDSINFSTDSINLNFIPRDSDGKLRYFGDTANADLTAAQVSKWFLTGPSVPPTPNA